MHALILPEVGAPLKYDTFSLPKPGSGDVQIRVRAAALNRRDVWITKGKYPGIQTPAIMGSDVAGVYEGRDVIVNPAIDWGSRPEFPHKSFHILGMPTYGGFAENLIISQKQIYDKPPHLDYPRAAALPLAGLTAYRALFTKGGLRGGERLMITGIGGGVALMAMQFALAMGSEVYVSSGSDEKLDRARTLGAAGGVNYRTEDWPAQLKEMAGGFDLVIDSAGGQGFSQLVNLTNPGGRMVIYGGTTGKIPDLSPQRIFWRQISIHGTSMGNPREFGDMLAFVREKEIVPVVDSTFPLSEGQRAFEHLERAEQFGKVVLVPDPG